MGSHYIRFLENINSINETDYGDFMRKVNEYLNDLKNEKSATDNEIIKEKINEIQTYVQYRPNWDLESTKEKLLHDAEDLIHLEAVNSL